MIDEDVEKCFNKICENFGIVAGLNISELMQDCTTHRAFTVSIDMNVGSVFRMCDQEIIMNKIRSKKDYRKLRRVVRLKLIDALYQIQNLTEDSLRSLGAKA